MLQANLDKVDEAELQRLIDARTSETSTLEFKQQPHGTDEDDKVEFAKDTCAMANADGGDIVFGIAEAKHVASKLIGMPAGGESYDAFVRRLTQVLEAKVEPRLRVQFRKIDLQGGTYAAVMRVPSSFDGPHWVRGTQELRRFVTRNGTSITDMNYDQVRAAFDRTATIAELAQSFIAKRLNAIAQGISSMPLGREPQLVTHIVPFESISGRRTANVQSLYDSEFVRFQDPDWDSGCSRTFNFDGLIVHPGSKHSQDEVPGYCHVFRTGCVETTLVAGWEWHDRRGTKRLVIPSARMTKHFRTAAQRLLANIIGLGYSGPALLSIAVLNAQTYVLGSDNIFHQFSASVRDRSHLEVPPAWVASIETADVDVLLRPMLDMLFQAFDVKRCPHYDEHGVFKPPK